MARMGAAASTAQPLMCPAVCSTIALPTLEPLAQWLWAAFKFKVTSSLSGPAPYWWKQHSVTVRAEAELCGGQDTAGRQNLCWVTFQLADWQQLP